MAKNNSRSSYVKRTGTRVSLKKKQKRKNIIFLVIFLVFLLVFLFSIVKILFWAKDNRDIEDVVESINKDTVVNEIKDDKDTEKVDSKGESKKSDYWYFIKMPLIDVDIVKLKAKNSDTVGWIKVNNTNINYPFVQGKNNKYYLTHAFDGSVNEAGWVFLDYRNDENLSDKNNIIYAHSRLDKTMFGSLKKVLNREWFENRDNHIIRISNEKENTMWQVFSVYTVPKETYYLTTDFNSDTDYLKFLKKIKKRSIYNFDASVSSDSKILTLSTCYSDNDRVVVHAKLIKRSVR
jgi:sortase B